MNLSKEEIFAYNAGLKQAQWQVTKTMLAIGIDIKPEIKQLLKFIHDEMEKELK